MTATTIDNLTRAERAELLTQERLIQSGLSTYRTVGGALERIREAKLYRESHKNFEDYCLERWRISRPRAYQLIEAAAAAEDVASNGSPAPATERVARVVASLPEEKRQEIWEKAVEAAPNGKPTADGVRKLAGAALLETLSPEEQARVVAEEAAQVRAEVQQIESQALAIKDGKRWRWLRRFYKDLSGRDEKWHVAKELTAELMTELAALIPESFRKPMKKKRRQN